MKRRYPILICIALFLALQTTYGQLRYGVKGGLNVAWVDAVVGARHWLVKTVC